MSAKRLKQVLKEQIKLIEPDEEEIGKISAYAEEFIRVLKEELGKKGKGGEVFIGGSFAKGTMLRKDLQDTDIFVRFDWKFDNLSDMLEGPVKNACKKLGLDFERMHGSRDYFRVYGKKHKSYFEIIPVTKIKKPKEERNVTDLTYFHGPYVKKKIKGKENEVRLAKTFMQANGVYGAETYVRGFSGYAVELLIIYYGVFEKMLRELVKVKKGERIVIDIEKHYKKKNEVFFEVNENKLQSPVILIDPTYKERNALAALSRETFELFQQKAKEFLAHPSEEFFRMKGINLEGLENEAKKNKAELIKVEIKTDKQAGDIAGTKLKKFHYVVENEIRKYFELFKHDFIYDGKQKADFYLIAKPKKEVIRIGPPLHMKKRVIAFKRKHIGTYEANGMVHAKLKLNFNAKSYLDSWKKGNKILLGQMSITEMKVI